MGWAMKEKKQQAGFTAVIFALLLAIPHFIFIFLNEKPFMSDARVYGTVSLKLLDCLIHRPLEWPLAMLYELRGSAPMLAWLGQFFVPLRYMLGSIDVALLFTASVFQAFIVWMFFKIIVRLFQSDLIAVIGSLVIISAPFYHHVSTIFYGEQLQVLVVVWFIYILVFRDSWKPAYVLIQVLSALAFGQLVKASTILYVVVPLILIVVFLVKERDSILKFDWKRHLRSIFVCMFTLFLFLIFYSINFKRLFGHAHQSFFSVLWGTKMPPLEKVLSLASGINRAFLITELFYVVLAVFLLNIALKPRWKFDKKYNFVPIVALSQIGIVMTILSFGVAEDRRFIVALLPFFALLFCWFISFINKKVLLLLILTLILIRFVVLNLIAFNVITPSRSYARGYHEIDRILLKDNLREATKNVLDFVASSESEGKKVFMVHFGEMASLDNSRLTYYLSSAGRFQDLRLHQREANQLYRGIHISMKVNGDPRSVPLIADDMWRDILKFKPFYFISSDRESILRFRTSDVRRKELSTGLLDRVEGSGLYEKVDFPGGKPLGMALYRLKAADPIIDVNLPSKSGGDGDGRDSGV